MTFFAAGGGLYAPNDIPHFACTVCGGVYSGISGPMPCGVPRCTGEVIDITAAIAELVPTYDPCWWIVATGDNVINPRWETPRRHVSEWDTHA